MKKFGSIFLIAANFYLERNIFQVNFLSCHISIKTKSFVFIKIKILISLSEVFTDDHFSTYRLSF